MINFDVVDVSIVYLEGEVYSPTSGIVYAEDSASSNAPIKKGMLYLWDRSCRNIWHFSLNTFSENSYSYATLKFILKCVDNLLRLNGVHKWSLFFVSVWIILLTL